MFCLDLQALQSNSSHHSIHSFSPALQLSTQAACRHAASKTSPFLIFPSSSTSNTSCTQLSNRGRFTRPPSHRRTPGGGGGRRPTTARRARPGRCGAARRDSASERGRAARSARAERGVWTRPRRLGRRGVTGVRRGARGGAAGGAAGGIDMRGRSLHNVCADEPVAC